MSKPIISVVICSYNRAELLRGALQSLVDQTADKSTYEVIAVDNMSPDHTWEVIQEFVQKYDNFKGFQEHQQGSSPSRNRGFHESSAEYVGFLDDDGKATPDWVKAAIRIIQEKRPAMFGGPITPFYEGDEPPAWMKDAYNTYSFYTETGNLKPGEYLSASNMVVRGDIFTKYGEFNPELGMKGNAVGYHEETALQLRAREDGCEIYFDPELISEHIVRMAKQNILYYFFSNFKSGKDGKYLWDAKYSHGELLSLFKDIDEFFMGIEHGFHLSKDEEGKYPYPENYVMEKLMPGLFGIGSRLEYFSKTKPVSLEDYMKDFVVGRGMSLSEYMTMYRSLSGRELTAKDVISAYAQMSGGKVQAGELIQAYRRYASAGLVESVKNAMWMILLSKPVRPLARAAGKLIRRK